MNTYLEIVRIKGGEVVKRLDVTGKGERGIERTMRGMLMRIDREKFFVNENETEEKLELI